MRLLLRLVLPSVAAIGLLPRLDFVPGHAGVPDTKVEWFTQPLDHFDFAERRTWKERVLTYDRHWVAGGPILFYCGNGIFE